MSPRQSSALTLEHVLLALLEKKPMHGYELYQELCRTKGISLIWNIKQSLLYAILDKLEARDFLTSQVEQGEGYPPRKYFRLTEFGRSSLQSWIKTPERRARSIRQEFLAKLIIAQRYGPEIALELLHAQQEACRSWSKELEDHPVSDNYDQIDEWFVYSFRVQRVNSLMNWLQECEEKIRRGLDLEA